jgi:hypothetical protein
MRCRFLAQPHNSKIGRFNLHPHCRLVFAHPMSTSIAEHCTVIQGLEVAIQTQREPAWATHFANANHFNIQRCGATAARPGGRRLMMSPQRRWSLWRGPSTPSRKRSFGIGEARLTVSLAPLSTRKPVWRLQNNLRLVRSGIVRAYFPMHIMFH